VKLRVAEKRLVPPAFVALARQKYCVLVERPLTGNEVAVIPLWLTRRNANAEVVES
jgi:hypothetical protein